MVFNFDFFQDNEFRKTKRTKWIYGLVFTTVGSLSNLCKNWGLNLILLG